MSKRNICKECGSILLGDWKKVIDVFNLRFSVTCGTDFGQLEGHYETDLLIVAELPSICEPVHTCHNLSGGF